LPDPGGFIDAYLSWLKENYKAEDLGGAVVVTTPFLDSHNDHIRLCVKRNNGRLTVTDDGHTVADLEASGCDLASPRRKDILQSIVNGFGVKFDGKELYAETTESGFPQKQHALLQAALAVSDMFMLTQNRVVGVFLDEVDAFLTRYGIRYAPSVQISGASGFLHTYDFVIPASKQKPERFVKAINRPARQKAESVLFAWNDTKDARGERSTMYVFLNDAGKDIRPGVADAFSQYDVNPVLWSKRNDFLNDLTA